VSFVVINFILKVVEVVPIVIVMNIELFN